jgi:hypothetical protein
MMQIVEIHRDGVDLVRPMAQMRTWLDGMGIQPLFFRMSPVPVALSFASSLQLQGMQLRSRKPWGAQSKPSRLTTNRSRRNRQSVCFGFQGSTSASGLPPRPFSERLAKLAGTELSDNELERLWRKLEPLAVDKMPLSAPLRFGSPPRRSHLRVSAEPLPVGS